jgi:hypothetical protein
MSNTPFSVVFFAVGNDAGAELARLFTGLMSAEFGLAVRVVEGATQTDLHRACLEDDIVVFDASVEEGHNYAAATAQPMVLDKVLVVARTYLPLNFYGQREGGVPDYEPGSQTNETILAWLRENVGELLRDAARAPARKGLLGYFSAIRTSLDTQQRRWASRGRIFISYRSRHFEAVEKLRQRIQSGGVAGVPPSSVRLLRPGEVVYEDEMLTKFRHWQLASMIDRKIGAAEEMWVYGTEDYLASWWTRAELVTIAYRLACGVSAPRLRLYDPATGTLRDLPEAWLPPMSREQRRRMARWYSNTDPGTMGFESVQVMRFYSSLPLLGRLKYFNDPVWSEEFWEDTLLPCATCGRNSPTPAWLDLDAFLWLREPHLVRLTTEQLEAAVERGHLPCPVCQTTYEIREAPNPRLLWLPVRYGRPTGPDGASLVGLPVYRASKRALLRRRRVS